MEKRMELGHALSAHEALFSPQPRREAGIVSTEGQCVALREKGVTLYD